MKFPKSLPAAHHAVLNTILAVLTDDPRIVGVAASGSYAADKLDQYSDLDLVVAIEPEHYSQFMATRFELVSNIQGHIASFSGEHVGEPRLVIALYGSDAIHVDFKFVLLEDAAQRVDENVVLWQREQRLSDVLNTQSPRYPQPDPQWIEDRFWIWTHYAATKIARGEYFESLEFISFLRSNVLSPLALKQAGLTPSGVRKIETRLPEFHQKLLDTVATPNKASLIEAMNHTVSIYLELRENETVSINAQAQQICCDYLKRETAR